jgi:hypothetical protein
MADQFIPSEDGLALTFMLHFATTIAANPSVYMLTAGDSTTISNAVNAYQTAYTTATNPLTRTQVTVALKDEARTTAEQVVRQYAALIKPNAGISDADKIAIGVPPVNPNRNPINVPASSPLLNIVGATPGSHTLRYADTTTPDSAKKPFGAMSMQLFVAVGTGPVASPDGAQFYAAVTRNPVAVGFDAADNGKTATYFARWADRKGAVGPWSLPVSMAIAA